MSSYKLLLIGLKSSPRIPYAATPIRETLLKIASAYSPVSLLWAIAHAALLA